MNLYKLENIKRIHGSRTVLHIEDLAIKGGKIYTLIGPNGAGKTTLLKILSFLDLASSGKMYFMDEEVGRSDKHLYPFRKRAVLLDQSPIMFSGTVWQNVEYGLKIRGIDSGERKRRILEALSLVGMERFQRYDARGLSGGENKRIALARAIVLQPEVLLCDEPTANVDGENQEIILSIIEKINREMQSSVIFSTHYLSQGQRLADETLLLQNGSLSDMVSENIFRITIAGYEGEKALCQLTGQLLLKLPREIVPSEKGMAKVHLDPYLLQCNPDEDEQKDGNVVFGHITELSQDSGSIRLGVQMGVKVSVVISRQQYDRQKPVIGEKVKLVIPDESVGFSSFEPLLPS